MMVSSSIRSTVRERVARPRLSPLWLGAKLENGGPADDAAASSEYAIETGPSSHWPARPSDDAPPPDTASASGRPNEIEEKEPNPYLKFLTYFWGPIPWMIEA